MGGGGIIYTKDFKELKRNEKITLIISVISLIIAIIALIVALAS